LLEAAERVKDIATPYTLRFITFGSEEEGEKGSTYYVSQMSKEDIARTAAMVNLDSLTAGDFTYIYGTRGQAGSVRDWTLNKARSRGLNLITQPGLNPQYPAGTTGDFSDHAPFRLAGIQYAYLEATNWNLEDKDGYTQVDLKLGEKGQIWHTRFDTLDYLDRTFPGRVDAHLNLFATLLVDILTEYKQPE
jgi:Zn-dependent M28 family amino/carboxypeptidase